MHPASIAPGPRPSIGDVISSSLRDTVALAATQKTAYVVLVALSFVVTLLALAAVPTTTPMRGLSVLQASFSVGALSVFFALPAAFRSYQPEFRMTFGSFLMLVAVGIGLGLAVEIGFVLLLIPGFLALIRLYFAPFFAALGTPGNPFGRSWDITKGYYWPTFGLLFAVSVITVVAFVIMFAIAGLIAVAFAPAAILFGPLVTVGYIVAMNFEVLALVRWLMQLAERHATATSRPIYTQSLSGPEFS